MQACVTGMVHAGMCYRDGTCRHVLQGWYMQACVTGMVHARVYSDVTITCLRYLLCKCKNDVV